jgi:hypothetical protein
MGMGTTWVLWKTKVEKGAGREGRGREGGIEGGREGEVIEFRSGKWRWRRWRRGGW